MTDRNPPRHAQHPDSGHGQAPQRPQAAGLQESQSDGTAKQQKPEDQQGSGDEQGPKDQSKPKSKIATALIVLAIVLVLLGAAWIFRSYRASHAETDDASIDAYLAPVSSRVSGFIQKIYVDDNALVQAGELLVQLDPSDYQAQVESDIAAVAEAEAQVLQARPGVGITQTTSSTAVQTAGQTVAATEATVAAAFRSQDSAREAVHEAEANDLRAQQDEARYRKLLEKEDVSQEIYQQKLATARVTAATLASNRAKFEAAGKQVAEQDARLQQSRDELSQAVANERPQVVERRASLQQRLAQLKRSRAQLHLDELKLSYCKIFAPVTGIVGHRTAQTGGQISPGQELLVVSPVQDIWVRANYKETEYRHIRTGQTVSVHVDALDASFTGYVDSLPGATGSEFQLLPPENATGNFVKVVQRLPVRILFQPNQPGFNRLRPGMNVETTIKTQ
jgi:membrane fusion protein, multidrug efflux system